MAAGWLRALLRQHPSPDTQHLIRMKVDTIQCCFYNVVKTRDGGKQPLRIRQQELRRTRKRQEERHKAQIIEKRAAEPQPAPAPKKKAR